jgi:aryl-alcohol dehydrogenase-like predicted oxidoreductase
MKLALGTVQFGLKYGINNHKGIPTDYEISSILQHAKLNGIDMLDSASAYGNAELKIGELSSDEFKIVSKFSDVFSENEFKNQLNNTLIAINKDTIYAYLAHNAHQLIKNPFLWQSLLLQKQKGYIGKIGYSLYKPEQLEILLNLEMIPDIVQLPYSLLDRKFEPYFENLKSLGVEVHVRSVFLQGLYFIDLNKLPVKFESLRNELSQLKEICIDNNISIGSLSLNFVYNNPQIDKVVIGVDSLDQLIKNLNFLNESKSNNDLTEKVKSIKIISPEMLNPANW